MYNNPYNKYKEARDAAWRVLIDNDIRELPLSLVQIARNNGIKIVRNTEAKMLPEGVSGMSILEEGQWYIIYNDEENAGRRRFTIAHELGHIFLGHESVTNGDSPPLAKSGDDLPKKPCEALLGQSPLVHQSGGGEGKRPQEEIDADSFAVRLLAPACVLWGLNIHTAEEIQKVCGLSRAAAEHRAKRMEVLYERNKFLISPLERKVYGNFEQYIKQNRY